MSISRCMRHYQQRPVCSAKTPGIQQALSNVYLKSQGFYALRDGSSFTILGETPVWSRMQGVVGAGG
jgi:hypothetical protein